MLAQIVTCGRRGDRSGRSSVHSSIEPVQVELSIESAPLGFGAHFKISLEAQSPGAEPSPMQS